MLIGSPEGGEVTCSNKIKRRHQFERDGDEGRENETKRTNKNDHENWFLEMSWRGSSWFED